jgi:hypothetical protein
MKAEGANEGQAAGLHAVGHGGIPRARRESLTVELPTASLEAVAERAAELVLERLPDPSPLSEYLTVGEAAEFLRAKPQRV